MEEEEGRGAQKKETSWGEGVTESRKGRRRGSEREGRNSKGWKKENGRRDSHKGRERSGGKQG